MDFKHTIFNDFFQIEDTWDTHHELNNILQQATLHNFSDPQW